MLTGEGGDDSSTNQAIVPNKNKSNRKTLFTLWCVCLLILKSTAVKTFFFLSPFTHPLLPYNSASNLLKLRYIELLCRHFQLTAVFCKLMETLCLSAVADVRVEAEGTEHSRLNLTYTASCKDTIILTWYFSVSSSIPAQDRKRRVMVNPQVRLRVRFVSYIKLNTSLFLLITWNVSFLHWAFIWFSHCFWYSLTFGVVPQCYWAHGWELCQW